MIPYNHFQYIYPPRPEHKTPSNSLKGFEDCGYIAQPKYNGSCCMVFTNGVQVEVWNRHKQRLLVSAQLDFSALAQVSDKWFVFAGEYLNKGKLGENGNKEADKFVIWDCLVWAGEYLVGKTLTYRLDLLELIYPCERSIIGDNGIEMYEHLCCTRYKGIYKAPTYTGNFDYLYKRVVRTDLYEGLVLKKADSKLQFGFNELNNHEWQIKCRKETKLYNF